MTDFKKWKGSSSIFWKLFFLGTLIFLLAYGCSKRVPPPSSPAPTKPYKIGKKWYKPLPDSKDFHQRGNASWYGKEFHGRKTASGEIYNMHAMTGAHKTLPMGTYVSVHNLRNGKKVVVRINDRGPFVKGRIIDLSYAAAKKIGLIGPGVVQVKIVALGREVGEIDSPLGSKPVVEISDLNIGEFTVQVGAFKSKENAIRLSDRLKVVFEYVDVEVCSDKNEGLIYRVRVSTCNRSSDDHRIPVH